MLLGISDCWVVQGPEEVVYEDWDCPRVEALQDHQAEELNIRRGQTARVLRRQTQQGQFCSCSAVFLKCLSCGTYMGRIMILENDQVRASFNT